MNELETLPWDRHDGEPETAYSYFARYRDLGRARTVAKVAEQVHKNRGYMHNVARAWRWVRRVQAWDAEQDRLYAEALTERRRDMADRHAKIAAALQSKIVTRLQALDPTKLTPADISRWLEVATRVERLALGLPDSTTAHTGPDGGPIQAEVNAMPEQQRAAFFRALVAEAQSRAGLRAHDDSDIDGGTDHDGVGDTDADTDGGDDKPAGA